MAPAQRKTAFADVEVDMRGSPGDRNKDEEGEDETTIDESKRMDGDPSVSSGDASGVGYMLEVMKDDAMKPMYRVLTLTRPQWKYYQQRMLDMGLRAKDAWQENAFRPTFQRNGHKHRTPRQILKSLCAVISPSSRIARFWITFIMVIDLTYASFMVPIGVAFCDQAPGKVDWCVSLDTVLGGIYMINLYFGFTIGYVLISGTKHLRLVSRSLVARVYVLHGSFWSDILAIVPWLYLVLVVADVKHGSKLLGYIRLLLALRMVRIIPMVKQLLVSAYSRPTAMSGLVPSTTSAASLYAMTLAYMAALVVNFFACLMYTVAKFEGLQHSWLQRYDAGFNAGLLGGSKLRQYVLCVYWIMTTMTTVGYGDVVPVTIPEQFFMVAVMLSGALIFGILVSSISEAMGQASAQYRRSQLLRTKLADVRGWLRRRQVDFDVRQLILAWYSGSWQQHQELSQEAEILHELPHNLRKDMMAHLTKKMLENIQLFGVPRKTQCEQICAMCPAECKSFSKGLGAQLLSCGLCFRPRPTASATDDLPVISKAGSLVDTTHLVDMADTTDVPTTQSFRASRANSGIKPCPGPCPPGFWTLVTGIISPPGFRRITLDNVSRADDQDALAGSASSVNHLNTTSYHHAQSSSIHNSREVQDDHNPNDRSGPGASAGSNHRRSTGDGAIGEGTDGQGDATVIMLDTDAGGPDGQDAGQRGLNRTSWFRPAWRPSFKFGRASVQLSPEKSIEVTQLPEQEQLGATVSSQGNGPASLLQTLSRFPVFGHSLQQPRTTQEEEEDEEDETAAERRVCLGLMASIMTPMQAVPLQNICMEGQVADRLWILEEGEVQVIKHARARYKRSETEMDYWAGVSDPCEDTQRTTLRAVPGKPLVLGHGTLLRLQMPECMYCLQTMRAKTFCQLWVIRMDDLRPILKRHPIFAELVIESLKEQMVQHLRLGCDVRDRPWVDMCFFLEKCLRFEYRIRIARHLQGYSWIGNRRQLLLTIRCIARASWKKSVLPVEQLLARRSTLEPQPSFMQGGSVLRNRGLTLSDLDEDTIKLLDKYRQQPGEAYTEISPKQSGASLQPEPGRTSRVERSGGPTVRKQQSGVQKVGSRVEARRQSRLGDAAGDGTQGGEGRAGAQEDSNQGAEQLLDSECKPVVSPFTTVSDWIFAADVALDTDTHSESLGEQGATCTVAGVGPQNPTGNNFGRSGGRPVVADWEITGGGEPAKKSRSSSFTELPPPGGNEDGMLDSAHARFAPLPEDNAQVCIEGLDDDTTKGVTTAGDESLRSRFEALEQPSLKSISNARDRLSANNASGGSNARGGPLGEATKWDQLPGFDYSRGANVASVHHGTAQGSVSTCARGAALKWVTPDRVPLLGHDEHRGGLIREAHVLQEETGAHTRCDGSGMVDNMQRPLADSSNCRHGGTHREPHSTLDGSQTVKAGTVGEARSGGQGGLRLRFRQHRRYKVRPQRHRPQGYCVDVPAGTMKEW